MEVSWNDCSSFLDLLKTIFPPDLLFEEEMLDLFNRGDLLIKEEFLVLDILMGDRLVLIRAELFYELNLDDESFWDLKKIRAGVETFFFDDEKPLSDG